VVLTLIGMAPAQGIGSGLDRRSPVSWPLYERRGTFPYTGALASVTYRPGELAGHDPKDVRATLRAAADASA